MMPSGETLYTFRSQYPDVLARGRANTVVGSLIYAGTLATVSAATFTLLDPSGTAITGSTLVLSGNIATVTIPALSLPSTLTLGEGYQEIWTLTVDGVAREYIRPAALARYQLVPALAQSDVTTRQPSLARALGAGVTVQSYMDQAWEEIIRAMLAAGHLPYLIRTPDAVRTCHLHLTLALALEACAGGSSNAAYLELSKNYREQYEQAWKAVSWQTDYDNDGRVDDPGQRQTSRGGLLTSWGSVGARFLRGA